MAYMRIAWLQNVLNSPLFLSFFTSPLPALSWGRAQAYHECYYSYIILYLRYIYYMIYAVRTDTQPLTAIDSTDRHRQSITIGCDRLMLVMVFHFLMTFLSTLYSIVDDNCRQSSVDSRLPSRSAIEWHSRKRLAWLASAVCTDLRVCILSSILLFVSSLTMRSLVLIHRSHPLLTKSTFDCDHWIIWLKLKRRAMPDHCQSTSRAQSVALPAPLLLAD